MRYHYVPFSFQRRYETGKSALIWVACHCLQLYPLKLMIFQHGLSSLISQNTEALVLRSAMELGPSAFAMLKLTNLPWLRSKISFIRLQIGLTSILVQRARKTRSNQERRLWPLCTPRWEQSQVMILFVDIGFPYGQATTHNRKIWFSVCNCKLPETSRAHPSDCAEPCLYCIVDFLYCSLKLKHSVNSVVQAWCSP